MSSHRFIKSLFCSTFLVCSSISLAMPGEDLGPEETFVCGPSSRDPETQKFVSVNQRVINELTKLYKEEGVQALAEYQSSLIPMANYLLDDVREHSEIQHISRFQAEIERNIAEENVSLTWLLGAHFRYAALLSNPAQDEQDFWGHPSISEAGTFEAFFQKDKNGLPVALNPSKMEAALSAFDEKNKDIQRVSSIPYNVQNLLNDKLNQHVLKDACYPYACYPLLGESILNVRFLLNCWLEGLYPIPFPTEVQKNVHGVPETSPFSFALHDLLHAKQDEAILHSAFRAYVEDALLKAQQPGVFLSDLIEQNTPHLVKKFNLFKSSVRMALGHVQENKKSLVGLFLLIHEFPAFTQELFKQESPSKVFELMRDGSLESLKSSGSWDNSSDPFMTNPTSGEISATDEEIKRAALQAISSEKFYYPPYTYKKMGDNGEDVWLSPEEKEKAEKAYLQRARANIKETKDFIHVVLNFENGKIKEVTYPTLYRKVNNFHAYKGLFKMAGLESLQKPAFNGTLKQNREEAVAFIGKRQSYLELLLNDAVADIVQHFQVGGENAFEATYRQEFQKIEADLQNAENAFR
ncbi:MAG: hypothetical protein ACRC4G_05330 [Alphaproteobacteria bacterium]